MSDGELSKDGQWQWDAETQEWKPAEGAAAPAAADSSSSSSEPASGAPEVSDDLIANMMDAAEQEPSAEA